MTETVAGRPVPGDFVQIVYVVLDDAARQDKWGITRKKAMKLIFLYRKASKCTAN